MCVCVFVHLCELCVGMHVGERNEVWSSYVLVLCIHSLMCYCFPVNKGICALYYA